MELSLFNEIVSSGEKSIVILSSEFCSPCKILKGTVDGIFSGNFGLEGRILIEDVLESGEIVSLLGVQTVPVVIFISNGSYVFEKGNLSRDRLVSFFD